MSAISGPLLQWLEDRLEQNKQRVQELQQEKEQLLEELAALEWGGNADPSGSDMKKSPRTTPGWRVALHCLSEGTGCASSLAAKSTAPGSGLYLPQLVQSSAVSAVAALLAQWWGWAAPEDSCSGEHTPRELVVSPSIFWQKSYCFTCIPGAWNRRVRGEKCAPAVISDAANFCLRLVASVDHGFISSNVLDHWSFTQAGKRWEGSLGADLEDLWHRIFVRRMSNQIKNSKAGAVGSGNEMMLQSASACIFWSVCILWFSLMLVCAQHWGSLENELRKWLSERGLWFLPRG